MAVEEYIMENLDASLRDFERRIDSSDPSQVLERSSNALDATSRA